MKSAAYTNQIMSTAKTVDAILSPNGEYMFTPCTLYTATLPIMYLQKAMIESTTVAILRGNVTDTPFFFAKYTADSKRADKNIVKSM
jgi:hypothetical protein